MINLEDNNLFIESDVEDLGIVLKAKANNENLQVQRVNYSLMASHLQEKLLSDGDVYFSSSKQRNAISNAFYLLSVGCGLLTAALDIFWVGEFDLETAHEWGKDKIERFVISVAQSKGYEGDSIKEAIRALEKLYKFVGDKATDVFGGGLQHHGRDFSHHFSVFGLIAALFTQFSDGKLIGTDENGDLLVVDLDEKYKEFIGKTSLEKIYNGTVVWFFHLVSDMAGSSGSNGEGTGIPGPILSTLKAFSMTPFAKNIKVKYKDDCIGLSIMVSKMFNGTAFNDAAHPRGIRFDLRTELGLAGYIGKKNIPNIMLEIVTCAMFKIFLFQQSLAKKEFDTITHDDIKSLISARTVDGFKLTWDKMLAISFGVKSSVESIILAIKSSSKDSNFEKAFYIFVNLDFYAIGRFAVCATRSIKQIIRSKKEEVFVSVVKNPGLTSSLLSNKQRKILYGLQYSKIQYDIDCTEQKRKKNKKIEWFDQWQHEMIESDSDSLVFKDKGQPYAELNREITESKDLKWLYMLAIALVSFEPYFKLDAYSNNSNLELVCNLSYENDVFCNEQNIISYKSIENWSKEYIEKKDELSGRKETIRAKKDKYDKLKPFREIASIYAGIYLKTPVDINTDLDTDDFEILTPTQMSDNIFEYSGSECSKLYVFSKCVLHDKYNDLDALSTIIKNLNDDLSILEQAFDQKKEIMEKKEADRYEKQIKTIKVCCRMISNLIYD